MRTLLCSVLLGFIGCGKMTSEPLHRELEVTLDGSITKVGGHSWPQWSAGYADATAIQEPRRVSILFTDGHKLETKSNITFLRQKEDRVCLINISPLLEETSYKDAVKVVRTINLQLPITNLVSIENKLVEWESKTAQGEVSSSVSFRERLKDGITVFIEIRSGNVANKWIVSYEFTLDSVYGKSENRAPHTE